MKTGRGALTIAQVNYSFDSRLTEPDAWLERYFPLTGWGEALAAAGAGRLAVVQRFHRTAAYFSAADLFVVGSHHEGSGYALMEACACGAVPVVTDLPTFRLLTGGAGALWSTGDAAAFASALADVGVRDLQIERARLADHFARELTWDAVGRRALEIYEEVLSRRRSIRPS